MPEPDTTQLWYYGESGAQRGPVSFEALRAMAASGQVRADTLVWTEGMVEWAQAKTVAGLLVEAAPVVQPIAQPIAAATPHVPSSPPPSSVEPLGYAVPLYQPDEQNGRAVTALVLGICSMPSCFCPFVGLILGAVAIIMGAGVRGGPNKGLAVAGVVCGSVGAALGLLSTAPYLLRI